MKTLHSVYQIDAFTNQPFKGNSAGVVYSDELNDEEMQLIAREFNLSETAFISNSDKADFNLRWFTPQVEVKLCGHATIASMHYLIERGIIKRETEVKFDTLSGILTCNNENNLYYLNLPVPKIELFEGNRKEILQALSINTESINTNFPLYLVDKSYLFIYVKSLEALGKLKPDFSSLLKLTKEEKEFDAVAVFTKETFEKANSAHSRFYAPAFGIDEDPVTGSANGPLLLILMELGLINNKTENGKFIFEQGDFIGREGRVTVAYSPNENKLAIAGNAVTILKGELNF
jgi:PhzF family phenazine biosynthesis protein